MVYKGLLCNEAGRVPHSDYVYFNAESNRLSISLPGHYRVTDEAFLAETT